MRSRILTLLLLLGAAVGLYAWAQREDARQAPVERGGSLFPGLVPGEVDYLLLGLLGGYELELQRERGGPWRITAPSAEVARSELVEVLLDNVAQARIEPLEAQERTLLAAELGLEPPEHVITVGSGDERRTVLLGAVEPLGGALYARRVGDERILLVPRNLATWLTGHAGTWIDPRLLRGLVGRPERVRVEREEGVFLEAVREADVWRLLQPAGLLGDDERITQCLQSLLSLQQDDVVDTRPTSATLHVLGLPDAKDAAAGELRGATHVRIEAADEAPVEIFLPRGWERLPDEVPVVRGDFAKILALPASALNALRGDADRFRERRLLPPVEERATRLALRRGDELVLDLRQSAEGWRYHAPAALAGRAADSVRVEGRSGLNEFLQRLDALEVQGFRSPPQDQPRQVLEIGWTAAGMSRLDRVELFAPLAEGVPALSSERPSEGLLLPHEVLTLVDEGLPWRLLERAPLHVDPGRLAEARLQLPESPGPLVLRRGERGFTGDDLWGRRLGLVLDLLRGLQGSEWRPARPGATHPWSIELHDADGAELARVAFRRAEPDEPRESLGRPAALASVSGIPGWELVVPALWVDRFLELTGDPR